MKTKKAYKIELTVLLKNRKAVKKLIDENLHLFVRTTCMGVDILIL